MTLQPKTINKFQTGLVLNEPPQILKDDAFEVLENAWIKFNRFIRREPWTFIGRLKRVFTNESLANSDSSPWSFNVYTELSITGEPNADIQIGSVVITIQDSPDIVFTDQSDGTLTSPTGGNSGTINYNSGDIVLTHTAGGGVATVITFNYFPSLPVMGSFDRNGIDGTVSTMLFDTKYAYIPNDLDSESDAFIDYLQASGITWSWTSAQLPYAFNYWQDPSSYLPLFWVTNLTGTSGDPIRYTNGSTWTTFQPTVNGTDNLYQARIMIPFRGMLLAFNTLEGATFGGATNYRNRVRASQIGTPLPVTDSDAWNDTIPGKGYFQDIPSNETIFAAYSLIDEIIIQTSSKTWLLSFTGIPSAPFRIDLIDDKLGARSTFANVNMGNYLEGIGNRLIQETTSSKVRAIDQKIENLIYDSNRLNQGFPRIYSLRNYIDRKNSYILPITTGVGFSITYPNRRLIHNYDNDSWAIYTDTLTCLGYVRYDNNRTWESLTSTTWEDADFPWIDTIADFPLAVGGNHQGFVGLLDSGITEGISLHVTDIDYNSGSAAIFTSPDHSLEENSIVELKGFIQDYASLNGKVGRIHRVNDENQFQIYQYDSATDTFPNPITVDDMLTYLGGGVIAWRRNFRGKTKAFNFLEEGQSIQVAYLDALTNSIDSSSIQLNVYPYLTETNPVNSTSTSFFGNTLSLENPTSLNLQQIQNRAIINQRANALSFEFTLSNATMVSSSYYRPFEMSSYTLWTRKAGRALMPFGGG